MSPTSPRRLQRKVQIGLVAAAGIAVTGTGVAFATTEPTPERPPARPALSDQPTLADLAVSAPAIAEYLTASKRSASDAELKAAEANGLGAGARKVAAIDGNTFYLSPGPIPGAVCLTVENGGAGSTACQDPAGIKAGHLYLGSGGTARGLKDGQFDFFAVSPTAASRTAVTSNAAGARSELTQDQGILYGRVAGVPDAVSFGDGTKLELNKN